MESKYFTLNGPYQKIIWIGVCGYVIINEVKEEILLVDPWPSYAEVPEKLNPAIKKLVNWLLCLYKTGYNFIGIVGTHEHYDHINDIPFIFHGLYDGGVDEADLPKIISDKGTFEELILKYNVSYTNDKLKIENYFDELYITKDVPLRYVDREKLQVKAGTEITTKILGDYALTFYVWDHASTAMYLGEMWNEFSGNYQRCSAFLLHHRDNLEGDKKMFFISSAGEMSERGTAKKVIDCKLHVDMLVQSIPHEIFSTKNYNKKLKELVQYQVRNITVRDKIVASHFENFIKWRSLDRFKNQIYKRDNQERIAQYKKKLYEISGIETPICHLDRFLIEYDTFYSLDIFGTFCFTKTDDNTLLGVYTNKAGRKTEIVAIVADNSEKSTTATNSFEGTYLAKWKRAAKPMESTLQIKANRNETFRHTLDWSDARGVFCRLEGFVIENRLIVNYQNIKYMK